MEAEAAAAAATAATPTKRLTDDEFAELFDERYEIRNFGDNIVFLQEFDKEVYKQTGYGVPSLKHSESTLTRSRLPLYKVNVNDVRTESGLVREEIRPGVYGRVPIALRRVGIKHDVIAAKFLSLNKSLILANGYDFIGDYCSENNNTIRALNVSPSGEVVNVSSDEESSPLGIVFKYYRNTAVTAKKEDNGGVVIPRGGSVEVELEEYPYNRNGNGSEVKGPCLFSSSNGSCCLPEGVFFDKYVAEDGKVRFYNTNIENDARICLDEYYFLGYIQYLYDVKEEKEMEVDEEKEKEEEEDELPYSYSSSDTVIDLDALKVNDTVNLKAVVNVEGGIKIPPYASVDVCMGRVKVVKGQEYDGPVCRLVRFPELVSAKIGVVLTQELLEEEEYETENLSITVFNVTNKDLIVQDGDVLVKVLVAEACVVF